MQRVQISTSGRTLDLAHSDRNSNALTHCVVLLYRHGLQGLRGSQCLWKCDEDRGKNNSTNPGSGI